MKHEVLLSKRANRELDSLGPTLRKRIVLRLEELGEDPFARGTVKLQGRGNVYRVRVGDYRILYEVLASELNGLKVYAAGMRMVGNVVDELIDAQGYTHLQLKLEKNAARMIFGEKFTFGSPNVRVPVSAVKIGDAVILKFLTDQLKNTSKKLDVHSVARP